MSEPWRKALRIVIAGWIGGAAPVLVAEMLRRSAPLFVLEEFGGLFLCAALLATASALGGLASSASGVVRALIAFVVLGATSVGLVELSPSSVVLALPWAFFPVAAGLILAQLRSPPRPKRAFQLATWGAVVGLFALHILRSSPWGARLTELAPHVPLLFGAWGVVLGLVIATGDGRELKGDLPLGSLMLFLFSWATSSTIGYAADRQALRAGGPETRARALASMKDARLTWLIARSLRAPTGDDRQDVGDLLVGALVFSVSRWPTRVEPPPPADVRCDLLRAVGDYLLGAKESNSYVRGLVERDARFQTDPAVRQVAIETMRRLQPDWLDPLELWLSDPDPDLRAQIFLRSISSDLRQHSMSDLLKLAPRAGEIPNESMSTIASMVTREYHMGDRAGAVLVARALVERATGNLEAQDREALGKIASTP